MHALLKSFHTSRILSPRLPYTLLRTMSSAPVTAPAGTIVLSDTEEKFVKLLNTFAGRYQPPIECRIAGGWVRDKLLSLPSHDLDIALSNPSAFAFADAFVAYLKDQGMETHSVGHVKANPEQSKHLETGTTIIMGLECDFVGLRSETYTDSRIPDQVQLGTPLEDAERRDLTVNSLFFNVHSREIEDWTGNGLADLEKKIARTPLPPRKTFLDDPLRVLRCVRFASRFSLSIEPEVAEAIKDEDIQAALRTKVSKERVGIEIVKALQKAPLAAMVLIDQLGLHGSIFTSSVVPPYPRTDGLKATQVLGELLKQSGWSGSDALSLAAAVCPFRGATAEVKKRTVPAVSLIISESLKLSGDATTSVTHLIESSPLLEPSELLTASRAKIGTTLQNPAVKPAWEQAITWAVTERILATWTGEWDAKADKVLAEFKALVARIDELGLREAIHAPPLLDGKQIQALISLRPGPLLGVLRAAVNEWGLDNPTATPAEAEAWLKAEWDGEGRAKWEASVPASVVKAKGGKAAKKRAAAEGGA